MSVERIEMIRFGGSLRPPLSWLGFLVTPLLWAFRPQLPAVATIVAKCLADASTWLGFRGTL